MAITVGKGSPGAADGTIQRLVAKSEPRRSVQPAQPATSDGKSSEPSGQNGVQKKGSGASSDRPRPVAGKLSATAGSPPALDAPPRPIFQKLEGSDSAGQPNVASPPQTGTQAKPSERIGSPGGGKDARNLSIAPQDAKPTDVRTIPKPDTGGGKDARDLSFEPQDAKPTDVRTIPKPDTGEGSGAPAAQSVKLARASQMIAAHKATTQPNVPSTTRKV